MDDLDLTGDERDIYGYGNTSRIASTNGDRSSSGAHRYMLADAMQSPPSPRRSINDQRAIHSGASSIKDNRYGHGNSVDSFQV